MPDSPETNSNPTENIWSYSNIVAYSIAIISISIAVSLYYIGTKDKVISYNVLTPSYKIYDNEMVNGDFPLTILINDSVNIEEDVFMTTLSVWNSGDLPINEKDIRKDIEIVLSGVDKIISFKPIKEVEKGVSDIKMYTQSDSTLAMDWKYFDPLHGIKIQLMYLGSEKIECRFNGSILNTKLINSVNEDPFTWIIRSLILVFSISMLFILTIILSYKFFSKKGIKYERLFLIYMIALFVFLLFEVFKIIIIDPDAF